MSTTGLLLAAGAGRRMGRPKALMRDPDGTSWLARGVRVLHEGGCAEIAVVLGAAADEAERLLHDELSASEAEAVRVVRAEDWDRGMSASLSAGLSALTDGSSSDAALVHLVDLPDVGAAVVARVLGIGGTRARLARAAYAGVPGHPVLLGRSHWRPILARASGDEGARGYLADHDVTLIECGDLAGGHDRDTR